MRGVVLEGYLKLAPQCWATLGDPQSYNASCLSLYLVSRLGRFLLGIETITHGTCDG